MACMAPETAAAAADVLNFPVLKLHGPFIIRQSPSSPQPSCISRYHRYTLHTYAQAHNMGLIHPPHTHIHTGIQWGLTHPHTPRCTPDEERSTFAFSILLHWCGQCGISSTLSTLSTSVLLRSHPKAKMQTDTPVSSQGGISLLGAGCPHLLSTPADPLTGQQCKPAVPY